jgi:hypothetical protein
MEQLQKKVRAVRRRLRWLRFASVTLASLFWLSIAAAAAMIVCRLIVPIDDQAQWELATWYLIGGLLALSIPLGLLGLLFGRMSLFHAAVTADDHLNLKERLSSALLLRGPLKPMEELLEADAIVAAHRIHPHRDFPFQAPRVIRYLPIPLLVLALTALLLEQRNLLANTQTALTPEQRHELAVVQEDNQEQAEQLEQLSTSLEEASADMASSEAWGQLQRELDQIAEQLRTPEASRLEQVAQLSNLADQVSARRREMEAQFAQNRNFQADPSAQMTQGLQQAMAQGDFNEAAQQIQQMTAQMQSGEMSADQMEQLAQELEQMAQQMGENSETGQALQQAAQAMRQAAQSGGQNAQAASQAMSQLSVAMDQMMDASQQLAMLEALEADLNARRAQMAQNPSQNNNAQRCRACGARMENGHCTNGNCNGNGRLATLLARNGQWRAGETLNRRGVGSGGPGQGRGGHPPIGDDPNATFRDEQVTAAHLPGRIIAEFPQNDGIQVPGESTIELSNVFLTYEQEAEHTLDTEVIPAGYRNITRGYFDSIRPAGTPAPEGESETAGTDQTTPTQ